MAAPAQSQACLQIAIACTRGPDSQALQPGAGYARRLRVRTYLAKLGDTATLGSLQCSVDAKLLSKDSRWMSS